MKITITEHKTHTSLVVTGTSDMNLHSHTFDDKKQAEAFVSGFNACKYIASSLVQSLPDKVEYVKATP